MDKWWRLLEKDVAECISEHSSAGKRALSGPTWPSWWQKVTSLVKIFVRSLKILEDLHEDPSADLWRSLWKILKDLQGSSKFLPRSSRTSVWSLRILEGPCMYLEDLCRNLIKSLKILARSLKILMDLWQDPHRSLQDPYSSFQYPYRSLQDPYSSLQDPYSSLQDPYTSL